MLRTRAPLTIASAFDLHVLGPPQTFALSQDQTLQFELCSIMTARDLWQILAQPVVGVATSRLQPDGVRIFRYAVPTSGVMVSHIHDPVFKERHLRRVGRGLLDGERLLLSLGCLVKSFFDLTFQRFTCGRCRDTWPGPLHHRVGDG